MSFLPRAKFKLGQCHCAEGTKCHFVMLHSDVCDILLFGVLLSVILITVTLLSVTLVSVTLLGVILQVSLC